MDILALVENHAIESSLVIMLVGILQGAVLARGIRNKFPSLKRHAKIVSAIFVILLSVNAIINIIKFTNPVKYSFAIPEDLSAVGIFESIISFVGLDEGIISSSLIFISVLLFLVFRAAQLHPILRYFIFILSVVTFGVFLAVRFTDFVPTPLQILLYTLYQMGIAIGVFVVSRRAEKFSESFV